MKKKLSVKSLLSQKIIEKNLIIMDDFNKEINKTRKMYELLKKFNALDSLIISDKKSKELIFKSVKNLPNVKLTDPNHFSSYDLLKFQKIILTSSSLNDIQKRYS